MKQTYSTYNGLSCDQGVDEMVSKYAERKGIDEFAAARALLGGDILDAWLSKHEKKMAIA